jgi:flagellar biosynthesis anti-sigma factor FlgM
MANSITGIGGAAAGQTDLLQTSQATQQTVQGQSPSANDPLATTQISDATSLSSLGSFIATAAKRASGQSSTRSDLVASLRAQIASGTYHPDPNAVAARVAAALKS